MITFLTVLFFIFSVLLIFVVVYQYRIKNTLKGRQSPEKEKLLNWLVTGVGIIFFVVVFLLAFSYNRMAMENKKALEDINQINQNTQPVENQQQVNPEQSNQTDISTDNNTNTENNTETPTNNSNP